MGQQSPLKNAIEKKLSELADRLTVYRPREREQQEQMIEHLEVASHVKGYLSSKELRPPR